MPNLRSRLARGPALALRFGKEIHDSCPHPYDPFAIRGAATVVNSNFIELADAKIKDGATVVVERHGPGPVFIVKRM